MQQADFAAGWATEVTAIVSGFREWRLAHPRATLTEIETALDAQWAVARARLVTDAALASAAANLGVVPPADRPRCPTCDGLMTIHGPETRTLTTSYEQPVPLRRHYAICAACDAALFPPG